VEFVVIFRVIAEGNEVALEFHNERFFNPALLIAQKHPDWPLLALEAVELALQHGVPSGTT
jgi:hypothetical protein